MKKVLVYFFIGFLTLGFVLTVFTKDKSISEMENKILAPKPEFSLKAIFNKSFMEGAERYVSDQFPFRFQFVRLKDEFEYMLGKREFKGIYVCDNDRLIERYQLDEQVLNDNIARMNKIASESGLKSRMIIIPTSIEFYKGELPRYAMYDDIDYARDLILKKSNMNVYYPKDLLSKYKSEYIYFRTDHHWTQLAAKYVYEDLYSKSIIENPIEVSSDFFGTYYSKAPLLNIKGDDIYAYKGVSNATMEFDYEEKTTSLYDDKMLEGKNKYRYFLHGDPALAKIDGKGEGEVLILKDSYAHNFIPFLINEYRKIHVIDPRYNNGSVNIYLENNPGISNIIFFHNIGTISNTPLYRGMS